MMCLEWTSNRVTSLLALSNIPYIAPCASTRFSTATLRVTISLQNSLQAIPLGHEERAVLWHSGYFMQSCTERMVQEVAATSITLSTSLRCIPRLHKVVQKNQKLLQFAISAIPQS